MLGSGLKPSLAHPSCWWSYGGPLFCQVCAMKNFDLQKLLFWRGTTTTALMLSFSHPEGKTNGRN